MPYTWWTTVTDLDQYQRAIIELPPDGDFLICGPPGSGKTNLLALRARYLIRYDRPNVVILTFTRGLREFLCTGVHNYNLPEDKVQTHVSWGTQLLNEYGIYINREEFPRFSEFRSALIAQLTRLVEERGIRNLYNCILLDEAQDYNADEIAIFRRLATNLYCAADLNQQIYRGNDAVTMLGQFCENHTLPVHYRNGHTICRLADAVRGMLDNEEGLQATSNYDEAKYPSSVEALRALTLPEQWKQASTVIKNQLAAYPGDPIGIMAAKRDCVGELWSLISEDEDLASLAQLHLNEYAAIDPERPIFLSTIHSAKGLEFRGVHIFEANMIAHMPLSTNLAYTAVTRAKTSLRLYHSAPLPGYLEAGLAALRAPARPPDLAGLFGQNAK